MSIANFVLADLELGQDLNIGIANLPPTTKQMVFMLLKGYYEETHVNASAYAELLLAKLASFGLDGAELEQVANNFKVLATIPDEVVDSDMMRRKIKLARIFRGDVDLDSDECYPIAPVMDASGEQVCKKGLMVKLETNGKHVFGTIEMVTNEAEIRCKVRCHHEPIWLPAANLIVLTGASKSTIKACIEAIGASDNLAALADWLEIDLQKLIDDFGRKGGIFAVSLPVDVNELFSTLAMRAEVELDPRGTGGKRVGSIVNYAEAMDENDGPRRKTMARSSGTAAKKRKAKSPVAARPEPCSSLLGLLEVARQAREQERNTETSERKMKELADFLTACGGDGHRLLEGWTCVIHTRSREHGKRPGSHFTRWYGPKGPTCRSPGDVARFFKLPNAPMKKTQAKGEMSSATPATTATALLHKAWIAENTDTDLLSPASPRVQPIADVADGDSSDDYDDEEVPFTPPPGSKYGKLPLPPKKRKFSNEGGSSSADAA